MSLEDPQYGALYYKAVKGDQSGLVAQCIHRRPKQITSSRPFRELPPHQEAPPIRPPYSRGIPSQMPNQAIPNNGRCFGCFETGHSLRQCPKMANMVYKGLVSLDHNLKYRLPDGQFISRKPEECLAEAINRLSPPSNQVQFATLGTAVESYYNKAAKRKYQQFIDEDSDNSGYETDELDELDEDEDEFEEAHWKWKAKHRQEFPTYVAYEAVDEDDEQVPYGTYPVERGDKTTHQARTTAMNKPVRRTQFDGVFVPLRRPRAPENIPERMPEKIPEPVPAPPKSILRPPSKPSNTTKSKENIPPTVIEPIPVDARKPRFKEPSDVVMKNVDTNEKKSINLQDYPTRPRPTEEKKLDPNSERNRPGPRQSELSNQVDSKAVVEQILDTQVSLPLRNILGASKELSNNFQNMIKYKNPNDKPAASYAAQDVFNSSIRKEDKVDAEDFYDPDYQEEDTKDEKALIKLTLYCNSRPITAVIDTGSQLNIVSQSIAREYIRLPINTTQAIIMNDVNGNSGQLDGIIKKVPLRCGEVLTEANLYIGQSTF